MEQFEKKYLDKQGYLDLRKLCPDNVNYLIIEETENRALNIMRNESKEVKSSDLIKWSYFSLKKKTEIVKIILINEKKFYKNKAFKAWEAKVWEASESPDLIGMAFVISMVSAQVIAVPAIGPIMALTATLPLIGNLLVGTLLLLLAIAGPFILLATLAVGFSYVLYKLDQKPYRKELATIDMLETELSSHPVNTTDQSNHKAIEQHIIANDQTAANYGSSLKYKGTLFKESSTRIDNTQENNTPSLRLTK